MNDKLVSILLPTRGRVEKLKNTLDSLNETVSIEHAKEVEILLRVDDDDQPTQDFLKLYPSLIQLGTVVAPRGNGYAELHHMYTRLCSVSSGRFLFLWNDDALMLTKNWDRELAAHDDGKMKYLHAGTNDKFREDFLFPIVHRSFYEALGHFSASAHNDTYVYHVLKPHFAHVLRDTNILIEHIALQLIAQHDQTHLEARYWWSTTKRLWNSTQVQDQLRIDQTKIGELLKQQGLVE